MKPASPYRLTRKGTLSSRLLAGSLLALLSALSAHADTLYWDPNAATAAFGTGGTWGTDAFWTADSTGAFVALPTGVVTTTSADNLNINQGNINSWTMAVSGDVYANSLTYRSNAGGANAGTVTNGGSGKIHLYASGLGNPFFPDAGGIDIRVAINVPVVLEAAGGSDVYIGNYPSGGNNAGSTFADLRSTNAVNLIAAMRGSYTITSLANFSGTIRNDKAQGTLTIGTVGTGVTSVTLNNTGSGITITGQANAHTGMTIIDKGTLNVAKLANIDTVSSIGKGTSGGSAADIVFGGGTLQYNTAAATSTDRLFTIGDGSGLTATLDSSHGTAANSVSFLGTGAIAFGGSGARTLTLAGSNTGTNTFAPLLGNGTGGATSLVKSGTGTWVITNAGNTYSGGTFINGGVLQVNAAGALGGSGRNVTVAGGGVLTLGYVPSGSFQTDVLSRLSTSSSGVLALGASTSENFDFSSGGNNFSALSLGSTPANATYTGTLTPNANTYRLGGGGGTLTFNPGGGTFDNTKNLVLFGTPVLSGATLVPLTGTVDFAGASKTFGAISIFGGTTQNGTLTGSSFAADTSAAGATVSAVLAGSGAGLTLYSITSNTNTLNLTGANTYDGTTTIKSNILRVGNGTTGSLNGTTGTALTFSNSGTFNVAEAGGSAQHMTSLTLSAGDATIQSTFASGSANLTFDATPTRSAGAAATFIVSGGALGTAAINANGTLGTNNIIITGQSGQQAMGVMYFAGTTSGNNYAFYDGAGFVRPLDYVKDAIPAGAATFTGAQTSLGTNTFVQLQSGGSVSAQANGTTFTGLHFVNSANSGQAFTLAAGATVTTNGILRSGNGGGSSATTISGGTALQAANNAEMVIRTDLSNDIITISANILANGANAITKTGAGVLNLSGTNTFSSGFNLSGGIVGLTGNNALGGGTFTVNEGTGVRVVSGNPALPNALVINGNSTWITGGANNGMDVNGPVTLAGTYTISVAQNNLSLTNVVADGGNGYGIIKAGGANLNLGNNGATLNTYSGKTIIRSGLVAGFISPLGVAGAFGQPTTVANGTIDMYNGTTLQFSPGGATATKGMTDRLINLADNGPGTVTVTPSNNNNATTPTIGGFTATGTGAKTLVMLNTGNLGAMYVTNSIPDSSDGSPTTVQVPFASNNTNEFHIAGVSTFTGPLTIGQTTAGIAGKFFVDGSGQLGSGTYANNIQLLGSSSVTNQSAGFVYNSSAEQILSGIISGAGYLTKQGAGTLTLSGNNTYAGTTTVSLGKLVIDGTHSGTGALNVSANATLGGKGTVSSNTTIANNGKLTFNLSTVAASHDKFDITGTLTFSSASTLDITTTGVLPAPGIYTLVTTTGGITGVAPATLNLPPDWVATTYKSGDNLSLLLEVTSTGSAPEIAVEDADVNNIPDGGSKAFGTVINGSNTTQTFTIKNTGTADLTGLTYILTGSTDFSVTASPTAPVSGPSGTTTFTVQFAPTSPGLKNASIAIANNDSDENPFDINLSGTGISAFDSWATVTHGLSGGNAAFDFDNDNDGIPNGMEWILGGNPTVNDNPSILPTVTGTAAGGLTLEFNRAAASIAETTLTCEWNTDISSTWNSIPIGSVDVGPSGINPTVDIDAPSVGKVTVNIPAGNTVGGKVFARLKATKP